MVKDRSGLGKGDRHGIVGTSAGVERVKGLVQCRRKTQARGLAG